MSILAGVCSLLLFLITPAAAGAADEPALCAMSGCSCTRHVEDDSISMLSCAGVGFTSVPSLEMYPNLTQLDLEGNRIDVLRATDLEPVRRRLKLLDLDRNGLHTIEEGALKDLPKLQHLFLSHNELTVIPAEVFDNKQEITTLDLSHNNLTAFPAGFNSVHAYTTFLINNNPIGNLSSGLFHGTVTRIETLDISYIGMMTFDPEDAGFDTLIGTGDGRPGLSSLYMDGNLLPVISNAMMRRLPSTLNTLSMRYCGIEILRSRAFTGMPGLSRLLLDGNNLGHLRRSPFYGLQLELLDLANCNIQSIRKDAFEHLHVRELFLQDNNITEIKNFEFGGFSEEEDGREPYYLGILGLRLLDLGNCSIQKLSGKPFEQLTDLKTLILVNNDLDNEGLGKALHRHPSLSTIILTGNRLTSVPRMPVSEFPRLQKMFLSHNRISSISREDFADLTELEELDMSFNPLEGFPEEDDTFKDSPELTVARFDHTHLTRLPNITYLQRLQKLHADHSRLTHLPQDLCASSTELAVLEIQDNLLTEIPTLSCKHLIDLDLSHNRLHTLHKDLLKGMPLVRAFNLGNNQISTLDDRFFENSIDMQDLQLGANSFSSLPRLNFMTHLVRLNISHNHLTSIPEGTFVDQVKLDSLYLNENDIAYIDPLSFPVNSELKILNLSLNSRLSEWVLPHGGFQQMAVLHMEELFQLHQVPRISEIPNVVELHLTYSYHCCIWDQHTGVQVLNITEEEESGHSEVVTHPTSPEPTDPLIDVLDPCSIPQEVIDFYLELGIEIYVDENCVIHVIVGGETIDNITVSNDNNQIANRTSSRTSVEIEFRRPRDKILCTPKDPLTSCEHLLEPWLQVLVWIFVVFILIGNGSVLFVGLVSFKKLSLSDLLVCNLAFAGLCLCVYLLSLAIVEVSVVGSSSFLDWQLGSGCNVAGFMLVFYTELSVYVLVVSALERAYSVLRGPCKREKLVGIALGLLGWILAGLLALLPIVGVNSYNRLSICLFSLSHAQADKIYVGAILVINLVCFLVILASYVYILLVCKKTKAFRTKRNISLTTIKIAVVTLIFFICLAPVAIIGYMALANSDFADQKAAKYLLLFVYPLSACVNPFLFAVFSKFFRSRILRRSKVTSDEQTRVQCTQNAATCESPPHSLDSCGTEDAQNDSVKNRKDSLVADECKMDYSTFEPSPKTEIECMKQDVDSGVVIDKMVESGDVINKMVESDTL